MTAEAPTRLGGFLTART